MSKTIGNIIIGEKASFEKTITEVDISLFAGISGDFNPIHINLEIIKKSKFKGRLAHGLLTASLISAVIGTKLPGIGTLYLKQDLEFIAPVFVGDTIKAIVEVIDVNVDKNIVTLNTLCINQEGTIVIKGTAIVKPPRILPED